MKPRGKTIALAITFAGFVIADHISPLTGIGHAFAVASGLFLFFALAFG
jgi:hypothetical protein